MVALFHLLDDVDDVLDAAIVCAFLRTTVAGAYFGRGEEQAIYASLNLVVGLGIERSPAEIAGRDKSGVDNSSRLKREDCNGDEAAQKYHWAYFIHFLVQDAEIAPDMELMTTWRNEQDA